MHTDCRPVADALLFPNVKTLSCPSSDTVREQNFGPATRTARETQRLAQKTHNRHREHVVVCMRGGVQCTRVSSRTAFSTRDLSRWTVLLAMQHVASDLPNAVSPKRKNVYEGFSCVNNLPNRAESPSVLFPWTPTEYRSNWLGTWRSEQWRASSAPSDARSVKHALETW